jgi:hypothetical protein
VFISRAFFIEINLASLSLITPPIVSILVAPLELARKGSFNLNDDDYGDLYPSLNNYYFYAPTIFSINPTYAGCLLTSTYVLVPLAYS